MNIVFLAPVGAIGGAERVLLDMAASLRATDPSLKLNAIVGSDGPLLSALREVGVEPVLLPMPRILANAGDSAMIRSTFNRVKIALRAIPACFATFSYALRLRRSIRRLQPDIVHSNGNKFHLLAWLVLGRRWPVVWHLHDYLSERPLLRRLIGRAARNIRGAIAISNSIATDARSLLRDVPIEVVPNAVDLDRFAPGDPDDSLLDNLARMTPTKNIVRVGLVATYARWKGQDVFLQAVSQLSRDLPGRFYIIGGPIYLTSGSQFSIEELQMRINELGLHDRVGLIGFQGDTPAIYRALDVVVHASTRPEPFGLTIAEAMACGRAVIVAAAGGASELFNHEVEALGVAPGNVDGLARAMELLITNSPLRHRLGTAARQTAKLKFGRARVGPQILGAYRAFFPITRCRRDR